METGKNNSPSLWTQGTDLSESSRLAAAIETMLKETESRTDSLTRLIPPSDCAAIIALVDARGEAKPTEIRAVEMAKFLMGMYPARQVNNADVFMTAASALFAAYDQDFIKRVCDPIDGLPSRLKYLPTIAEIKEALEAEKARRFKIRATANWMLKEHDRRKAEAEERKRWELTPEEIERRRAMVASTLRPMREATDAPGNLDGNAAQAGGDSGGGGDSLPRGNAGSVSDQG